MTALNAVMRKRLIGIRVLKIIGKNKELQLRLINEVKACDVSMNVVAGIPVLRK